MVRRALFCSRQHQPREVCHQDRVPWDSSGPLVPTKTSFGGVHCTGTDLFGIGKGVQKGSITSQTSALKHFQIVNMCCRYISALFF